MSTQDSWGIYTMYCECRGEPKYGQRGVAHVLMNRSLIRELAIKEVALQPSQFSCFNDGVRPPITNSEAYAICKEQWSMAREERLYGFSFFGADHYHATYIEPPYWTKDMEYIVQVGQHLFYKAGY